MINGLTKAGYFLIGVGVGIFASSFVLAYEFDKPVGEIEEFIPEGGYDNSDDQGDGQESDGAYSQSEVEDSNDIWDGSSTRRSRVGQGFRNGRSSRSDSGEEDHKEFQANQAQVLDYYKSADPHIQNATAGRANSKKVSKNSKRCKEFAKRRKEGIANLNTRYSKMFDSDNSHDDREMTDILHEVSSKTDTKDSYSQYERFGHSMNNEEDSPIDDYPPGDIDIHDEFVLERVEENIEIYLDDNPNDFVTLVWYQGDETLCDDGEQIIPNPEDVIGEVAITRLLEGGPGADDGVIFVHNIKTCVDYEVVLDMGCYSETVLGIFEARQSRLNNGGGKDGNS